MGWESIKMVLFTDDIRKEAYCDVREDVAACIRESWTWKWTSEAYELRKLNFYQHIDSPRIRRFRLGYLSRKKIDCVGQGATIKHSGDFLEYLFAVLADGSTVEAWTYKKEPVMTFLAYRGDVVYTIHSTWKSAVFNLFGWRERWEIFDDNQSLGFVDGKGVVKWNSLKLYRPDASPIPIHLAYPERKLTEVMLAPMRLICGDASLNYADTVIPEGTEIKQGDELLACLINIVFRELFFDLSYPSSMGS